MAERIQTFNLQRWFAGLSLISILLISSLSALLLSNFLSDTLLRRDAQVTGEYVQSVLQTHLASNGALDKLDPSHDPLLAEFFDHVATLSNVTRANIYDRQRTVIWSNRRELIGQRFEVNPELDRALAGTPVINMERLGAQAKAEHRSFAPEVDQFVEYYIPIWAAGSAEVALVVEIYKLPRLLLQDISTGIRLIWQNALLGGLFLFAVLFWIIYRAKRLIERQQRALVDAEKLAAVGEVASVIAHSIRNPLASIRSSAELLEEDSPEQSRGFATDILSEVDRLDLWIRELLTYTRHPTAPASPQQTDLGEVVRGCLQQLEERLARQAVRLEIELPPGGLSVRGESTLLRQVLISLLTNALEAMPTGGRLGIRAGTEGTCLLLEIEDSGCGIPAAQLEEVFQPLVTLKRNGLGLGLPLARQALEAWGGGLRLCSQEGVGTCVRLWLPKVERS